MREPGTTQYLSCQTVDYYNIATKRIKMESDAKRHATDYDGKSIASAG